MLLIHTALHAEAQPFIDHFRLKREHDQKNFACFSNEDIWLIESGIGKLNAASAIGWIGGLTLQQTIPPVILNIGMAGDGQLAVGECRRAQRIEDEATGKQHFPQDIATHVFDCRNLITYDQPCENYPQQAMVDMEASGFMQAAKHISILELVQSIKVISDNPQHPPKKLKPTEVTDLISPHLPDIESYAQELLGLRQQLDDAITPDLNMLLQRGHFSRYQQSQLQRLLQRYTALYPKQPVINSLPEDASSANTIINWLQQQLDHTNAHY